MPSWFTHFRSRFSRNVSFLPAWPWRTTAAQRRSLLRLIAVATEERLPLRPLLEAWAFDERGSQKIRLLRLLRIWQVGTPLVSAIEQVPGLLLDDDLLALRFGEQSGTLAVALRSRIEQSESLSATNAHPFRKTLFYCGVVMFVGLPIVWFIRVKIAPAFTKILYDYSMEAPQSLYVAYFFDRLFWQFWWLGALALLLLLWTLLSARPSRFVRNSILGRFFRPVRELRTADLLQKLGVAVQAGRPISGVLSTLARYHFDPTIRHKLLFVRNEVEQGAEVWQSMAKVGLLSDPERRALVAAETLGNRPWVLEQLALNKQRRTMRRIERLSEIMLPVLVIFMGVLVLVQSLAVMAPLTKLILGLT